MNRKLARELCMQMIFEMDFQKSFDLKVFENYFSEDNMDISQKKYIYSIVKTINENLDAIDSIIKDYSKGWALERLARVDLAIMRLAVCEILYMDDIPPNVSINEAIELAKKFSDDFSPSFINGILGKYIEDTGRNEK